MSTGVEAVPPPSEPPPPSVEEQLMRASAGFGVRFLARFVDLFASLVFGLMIGFIIGVVVAILAKMGKMPDDWLAHLRERRWHVYGLGILGQYLYTALGEGIGGTTLGKLACGLTVVQKDGVPCTLAAAFKRDLLYYFDVLFFGIVGYLSMKGSPMQQRYGDKWADTVVVKKDTYQPAPPRSGARIFLGILAGATLLMLCHTAGLLIKIYA
jgi:uncharacterized RDD family membrane protein YckC